jgi:hypothetical protein
VSKDDFVEGLKADLTILRQRDGLRLSKLPARPHIMALASLNGALPGEKAVKAEQLIYLAIAALPTAMDKLDACVMLAIDATRTVIDGSGRDIPLLDDADRADPTVAAAIQAQIHRIAHLDDRRRAIPHATFDATKDRQDRVTTELAYQLYKIGGGATESAPSASGETDDGASMPSEDTREPASRVPGAIQAELPSVFISYSRRDDNHIRVFVEHLRKTGIETLNFAIELPGSQALLIENIREHAGRDKRLLIALTPAMAESGWLERALPEHVDALEDRILSRPRRRELLGGPDHL